MIVYVLVLFVCLAFPVRPIQFNRSIWGKKSSALKATTENVVGDLFAVIGTGGCAESLYYGPRGINIAGSSDGLYRTYFSTNIPTKDIPTTRWLQIVTFNGGQELFRIYWNFQTAKTYTQRIVDAVASGEPVSYLVIDSGTGKQFRYQGTWRFSSQSGIRAETFAVTKSVCCFSRADGAWGAGSGVIDGNVPSGSENFWGLANYRGPDSYNCDKVYAQGRGYAFNDGWPITYMYQLLGDGPTAAPTLVPTATPTLPMPTALPTIPPPTAAPTIAPSAMPTYPAPTPMPSHSAHPTMTGQQMFASIGGDSCAATLSYGPQAVTAQGSADGQHASFVSTSTMYRSIPHTDWLQIVTSDGTTELFRIFWTFSVPRTLEGHFAAAATEDGATVAYRVIQRSGAVVQGTFVWRFTEAADFDAYAIFSAVSTTCCFGTTAIWGVGTALAEDGVTIVPAWGQANAGGSDADTCYKVYMDGTIVEDPGPADDPHGRGGRSYFYYSPDMSVLDPIPGPRYALVEFTVTMVIDGILMQQYQRATETYNNLFRKALSRSMSGVAEWNVRVERVSAYISSARYAVALVQSLVPGQPVAQAADTDDLQVQCAVRVEESPYSYAQFAYALRMAVASGAFDDYLQQYARYLRLNDAADASAVSVSTEQRRSRNDGSDNRGSGVSGVSATVIIIIVVFVVGSGGVWYYYESASNKRIGRVDVGSVLSQDEEAAATEADRSVAHPATGQGGWDRRGVRPDSVSVELSEAGARGRAAPPRRPVDWRRAGRHIQERHSVPRTGGGGGDDSSGSDEGEGPSALPVRRVASRQSGPSTGNLVVPYAVVRPTRVQPRGAVLMPYTLVRSSSARSEVVQVTPRSVQVQVQVAHSTPRRPSLTPIASAQLVPDGSDPAVDVAGLTPVTVVAVPLETSAAGRLVVAQASPARRR